MDIKTLEALGLSKEEIENKLIDRLVREFTTSTWADEDGEEFRTGSPIAKKLEERLQQEMKVAVGKIAEQHVVPNLTAMIENLDFTKTNMYGEKTSEKRTFKEHLAYLAESYFTEPVDYEGKTREESRSSSFYEARPRLLHMIDSYLKDRIKSTLTDALANANKSIIGGLKLAIEGQLKAIAEQLKVNINFK